MHDGVIDAIKWHNGQYPILCTGGRDGKICLNQVNAGGWKPMATFKGDVAIKSIDLNDYKVLVGLANGELRMKFWMGNEIKETQTKEEKNNQEPP